MIHFDPSTVTTAAIVRTQNVAVFSELLERIFATDGDNRHYLLIHNEDGQTIPIETVRLIRQNASFALGEGEQQEILFLWADLLSVPAQHALLKVLEEPPLRTRFWLVTQTPQSLLPTIQSRAVSIVLPEDQTKDAPQTTLSKTLSAISLTDIREANYSTLIAHAARPKDRAESKAWCTHLLAQARIGEDRTDYRSQRALLDALESLDRNGNGKLVLESCFFHIKQGS